jgi:hypothetical protein
MTSRRLAFHSCRDSKIVSSILGRCAITSVLNLKNSLAAEHGELNSDSLNNNLTAVCRFSVGSCH